MRHHTILLGLLHLGCAEDATGDKGPGGEETGQSVDSGDSAAPKIGPQYFAELDEDKGRLPDGLALFGDNLFVTMGPTGEIYKLDSRGRAGGYANTPAPGAGHLGGLAVDIDGNLYAALTTTTEGATSGLYFVAASTKTVSLLAGHPDLQGADSVALDSALRVYLSDPFAGALYKYSGGSALTAWSADAALAGDPAACGSEEAPRGASGLLVKGSTVYVTHADRGAVLAVAINTDGTAGAVTEVVAGSCDLAGLRGITRTIGGRVFAVASRANRVVELDLEAGTWTEIAAGEPIDEPLSVVVDEGRDPDRLYFSNAAAATTRAGSPARPGVLAIDDP